jgi:hypothetical protein
MLSNGFFELIACEGPHSSTVMSVTCWHVWEARNDARNNQAEPHPFRLAMKIKAYVDILVQFCFKSKSAIRREVVASVPRWSSPNSVCMNMDAALFPDERRMGWGVVLRDHTGVFIHFCCEGLPELPAP